MNTKLIRLLVAILCLSLCFAALASCDSGEKTKDTDTETATGTESTTDTPTMNIDKTEWDAMFADEVFENYTVIFEGRMSVTEDGKYDSTSNVWQKLKITADTVELTARAEDVGSPADSGEITMAFEGELAEIYKVQNSQLFLLILRDYDSFIYDSETKTYTIPNPVVIEKELKGIGEGGKLIDVPSRIELQKAVLTFAENGMIATLYCDYSQTMNTDGQVIVTSGETTWTFTDFGTTVIGK